MKHIFLALVAVAVSWTASAQGVKITSAINYMNNLQFDKAKVAIDEAVKHEKTFNSAKAWATRGKVYYSIYLDNTGWYDTLKAGSLDSSFRSYQVAFSLDCSKLDMDETNEVYKRLADVCFDHAVKHYNAKEYMDAVKYFDMCNTIKSKYNTIDTTAIYNCALSAELANNVDVSAKYYYELGKIGYKGARTYTDLANMYQREKRDDDALAALKEGRTKYPSDQDLLTAEINIYLRHEKFGEALQNLNIAIQGDPTNATFYFARGVLYNQDNKFAEAEKDYNKAIELKPDMFDAYYNLGALYFNQAAEYSNKVNEIKDNAKFAAEKKKADAMFEKSLPILEKAHEINGQDENTISSLMQLYGRLNMNDKYNEMKMLLNK